MTPLPVAVFSWQRSSRCTAALIITLCIGKFGAHGPTLPLIPEARSIRASHQDEPRIG